MLQKPQHHGHGVLDVQKIPLLAAVGIIRPAGLKKRQPAGFADLGYEIMATGGTAEYLKEKGVKVTVATKVSEGSPNILDDIKEGRISMVINTTNHGRDAERDGFKIRRSTVEHAIACLTSMDTARELQHVMSAMRRRRVVSIVALQDLAWEG